MNHYAQALPSPPAVVRQLLELPDEARVEEVARLIGRDPSLSARVLRIANSSLFALPQPTYSLVDAILLIGPRTTRTLVLGVSLLTTFRDGPISPANLAPYWRRSWLQAVAAKFLARELPHRQQRLASVAALLQDIGVPILACTQPTVYEKYWDLAVTNHTRLINEEQCDGLSHAAAGAAALTHWGLPEELCRAVGHHHQPGSAREEDQWKLERVLLWSSQLIDFYLTTAAGDGTKKTPRAPVPDVLSGPMLDWLTTKLRFESVAADAWLEDEDSEYRPPGAADADTLDEIVAVAAATETALSNAQAREQDANTKIQTLKSALSIDPLTGVATRARMEEEVDRVVTACVEQDDAFAVAFIDIDSFKMVNDTYGHLAGDAVLRMLAQRLLGVVADSGFVARYGGEEFVVILTDSTREGAIRTACRLNYEVRHEPIAWEGVPLFITVSIGLSYYRPGSVGVWTTGILESADQLLYRAKQSGRNTIAVGGEDPDSWELVNSDEWVAAPADQRTAALGSASL